MAFGVSVLVIAFGVIATSGTYGSRLAWFLGVAVPLLALSVLLAGWAPRRRAAATGPRTDATPGAAAVRQVVLVGALALVGIPAALAAMLFTTYGVFFVVHGVSLVV
jgi:peptidoglycan/LPS O-acetylase OafA/YrhL